jgi:hypothetical protein
LLPAKKINSNVFERCFGLIIAKKLSVPLLEITTTLYANGRKKEQPKAKFNTTNVSLIQHQLLKMKFVSY